MFEAEIITKCLEIHSFKWRKLGAELHPVRFYIPSVNHRDGN